MSYVPSLVPDTEDCKLHNFYDTQGCVLAAIRILIGGVVCFYGKTKEIAILRLKFYWHLLHMKPLMRIISACSGMFTILCLNG